MPWIDFCIKPDILNDYRQPGEEVAREQTSAEDLTFPEIDPAAEDKYWSEAYSSSPVAHLGLDYKVFQPACRYGWESFQKYRGKTFEDVESDLRAGWDQHRGDSGQNWGKARDAARAAWNRVGRNQRRTKF